MGYGRSIAPILLANCMSISGLEHLMNVKAYALTRLNIFIFDCFNVFFNLFIDMLFVENRSHHQPGICYAQLI